MKSLFISLFLLLLAVPILAQGPYTNIEWGTAESVTITEVDASASDTTAKDTTTAAADHTDSEVELTSWIEYSGLKVVYFGQTDWLLSVFRWLPFLTLIGYAIWRRDVLRQYFASSLGALVILWMIMYFWLGIFAAGSSWALVIIVGLALGIVFSQIKADSIAVQAFSFIAVFLALYSFISVPPEYSFTTLPIYTGLYLVIGLTVWLIIAIVRKRQK